MILDSIVQQYYQYYQLFRFMIMHILGYIPLLSPQVYVVKLLKKSFTNLQIH